MALTDAERRLLAELEESLTAQDPKLASKFTRPPHRVHAGRAVLAVVGILLGLAALVAGMSSYWWISVIGFVVMLASVFILISGWAPLTGEAKPAAPEPRGEDFLGRLEQRWRDRQEQ